MRSTGSSEQTLEMPITDWLWRNNEKVKDAEALATLNTALENIPDKSIPYSYFMPRFVELYDLLGEEEKAMEIAKVIGKRSEENLQYMLEQRGTFSYEGVKNYDYLRQKSLMILQQLS